MPRHPTGDMGGGILSSGKVDKVGIEPTSLILSISSTTVLKCNLRVIAASSIAISSAFPVSEPYKTMISLPSIVTGSVAVPSMADSAIVLAKQRLGCDLTFLS